MADIFISYTHNDNDAVGDKPGWVATFHDHLESWLVKRRGLSELKIWRDTERMRGNTIFDDAIKEAVKSSALFFALNSRNYLKSAYCQDELSWFCQYNLKRPGGLRVGEHSRIFHILLNNIPYQQWPEALAGTSGFPLHDAKSDEELGDFTSPIDDTFEKQLRAVVDAVEAIMQEFSAREVSLAGDKPETARIKIFVADVADTLQTFRDRIITEAKGKGAEIYTDIPPPMGETEYAESVNQALLRAQFSIHLFDQLPGRRIADKKQTTYPREQLEIALESPAPQLIWVPGELDIGTIEDETQRNFLDSLANEERGLAQYEFVSGTQMDFVNLVRQRIAELQSQPLDGEPTHTFLVDTHQKDQRHAFKLADYLLEQGVEVDFNHESRDPTLSLTKFEQSVRQVKNLIIMFGKVGPAWLHGRIKNALKTISQQFEAEDTCILENIWIYLTPASGGRVELPRFPPLININIVDNSHSDKIDPQVISRLLPSPGYTGGRP